MLFYIFLLISAYLSFKEFKKPSQRKKLALCYGAVFLIAMIYNLGSITGEVLYHLGITI